MLRPTEACTCGCVHACVRALQMEFNETEVSWENERHDLLKRLAEAEAGWVGAGVGAGLRVGPTYGMSEGR